ncbi:MAG: ADP-ribosylglycohydrolase family protein [Saprospiraceae bacterium]
MKKKIVFLIFAICLLTTIQSQNISKQVLLDKIKGGWAGQTIGVTFGGPVEFRFNGTIIQSYQPIPWYKGYVAEMMTHNDGLYDDLYMDLTWVEVLERDGLDASSGAFGEAFAHKDYKLWHANQAARYNILHGIKPPLSGHWKNNPHADCIDFQIEADFAGLMSPGMPNAANEICDRVGHVMNYGDGYYGGVFVANMYANAYFSNSIPSIIQNSLKSIPPASKFYKVIADVLAWHKKFPTDWKQTWLAVQDKWSEDIGCPDGVFAPFNIDATINASYIVIGLLYGNGDFTKTIEITTRCGQDADCNPSSAAGILGTIKGYSHIPAYWMEGLEGAENLNFAYTDISLAKTYELSFKHAMENIKRNGGTINGDNIFVKIQKPIAVPMEQSFTGLFPQEKKYIGKVIEDQMKFDFKGTGIVVKGYLTNWDGKGESYTANASFYIDDELIETAALPSDFRTRRHELFWKYDLPKGDHTLTVKLMNRDPKYDVRISDLLIYGDQYAPIENIYQFGKIPKTKSGGK